MGEASPGMQRSSGSSSSSGGCDRSGGCCVCHSFMHHASRPSVAAQHIIKASARGV